jgi:hypothetical protein
VSRIEVESVTTLASALGEAEGFTRRIALLESELMEVCQTWEQPRQTPEVCLTRRPMLTGGGRKLRGSAMNGFRSLPLCKPGVLTCTKP